MNNIDVTHKAPPTSSLAQQLLHVVSQFPAPWCGYDDKVHIKTITERIIHYGNAVDIQHFIYYIV